MEDKSIINLNTSNNNSTSPNESYKKINPYNITGINYIDTKKEVSTRDDTSKFNYLTETPNSRRETSEPNEKNEKLQLIRSFIKKPDDQMPYDGYACFRKKPTINYLLRKFDKKDNKIIFEKHKLCKKPYPLIKFLSNRKSPNHSKHLITDMLSAEFKELSIQQKNDIKYKNYKKNINLAKIEYPEIRNRTKIIRKINFSEKKNKNENNKIEFPLLNRYTEEKFLSKDNSTKNWPNRNIYSCLTIRPIYNDRKIKKSLMNSYCGIDNNLTEHNTVMNNISFLKNEVTKKLHSDYDDILKDISILKSNNHIMVYES
jgi:hypothetical protein